MRVTQREEEFTGKYIDSDCERKTKRKRGPPSKIIMNVSETQYSVVKFVGKEINHWALDYSPIGDLNFDVCWTDNSVKPEVLSRMQPHQKINHFPGMAVLSRKNNLGKNLMKLRSRESKEYAFFPMTFNLPNDYLELKCYNMNRKQGKAQTFIVKPQAGCQGRGIFLTRDVDKIKLNGRCVVQRYMHKPFLLDQLKFDLRLYVLLTGLDPLRIFVYEQGLVRLATEPYVPPRSDNFEQVCMHLTNYAINKESPNFVFNESATNMNVGHKRSLSYLYGLLSQKGHDVPLLKQKINDLIIKTFISGHPVLSQTYWNCQQKNFRNDMCFELLGFDIILNNKLNPILLQINYTPSFSTDTPLDSTIKKNAVRDALNLLNINEQTKSQSKKEYDKEVKQRLMSAKRRRYTDEEKHELIDKAAYKRDLYELSNLGGYTRIYPVSQSQIDKYSTFFDLAYELIDPNNNSLYPSDKYRKKTGKLYYQPQFQIPVIRSSSAVKSRKKKLIRHPDMVFETLSLQKVSEEGLKPQMRASFLSTRQIGKISRQKGRSQGRQTALNPTVHRSDEDVRAVYFDLNKQ